MPLVYFMRHGRAEASAPGGDPARALTHDGRAELQLASLALSRLQTILEVVIASPLVRAQETAAILHAGLAPQAPLLTVPELAPSGPGAAPEQLGAIAPLCTGAALVVGHAPDIGELVAYATSAHLSGAPSFEVGSVACVVFQGQVRPGAGSLRWMMAPAQLALLGRA